MNLICKITDKDIGKQPIEMDNPRLRLGARGIVIREDRKIAIFNKSNKNRSARRNRMRSRNYRMFRNN